jgi:predicted transcriptional regulator
VAAMPFQRKQERHRCHAGKMTIVIVVMTVMIMAMVFMMVRAMMPAAAFAAAFPHVTAFVQWEILAHPDIEFAHVSPCFDAAVAGHKENIIIESSKVNHRHQIIIIAC